MEKQIGPIPSRQQIPIVVTAFGTTTKAFETYKKMDRVFRKKLPDHTIKWAYSSRIVKNAMEPDLKIMNPTAVLEELKRQGHPWVVLQSLHLICGHELHRLMAESLRVGIRISLGLPLLSSPDDYLQVSRALRDFIPKTKDEAVVLVGHGTDHPSWTSYFALETILGQQYGSGVFAGVIEGYPGKELILEKIKAGGYKKISLVPFLLVAGSHFKKDLTREADSWQKTFERENIQVSTVNHGLGELETITEIFCRHIIEALDVIPL